MSGTAHPELQRHIPERPNPQAVGSLNVVDCDTSEGCIERS